SNIIGGTENFINIHSHLQYYFTLGKKHTFSPLLMFCWADQGLPPVEKLYVGGSLPDEKYRDVGLYYYVPFVGLKPRAMSGDIMLRLHGLYRFAITKKFFISAMADWGYAWDKNNESGKPEFDFTMATAEYFLKNAPLGVGLGLALQTPVGPLNLSFGRVVHGSLKDFGIHEENIIYFSAGYDF
ncbi:MAG: outer membrane protein assembly factor, partial [Ignavibacteria bacterium]|nr:outer membrane protein assembly factor [Ignavibacteria bacterium]